MGVYTAPLAIIRVNSLGPIGLMRNITVTENLSRTEIRGIGQLTPQELPAIAWAGTLACDFYTIDFRDTGTQGKLQGALFRGGKSLQEWIDSICLQQDGIQVDLYKTIPNNPSQVPMGGFIAAAAAPELICSVNGLFLNSESMNLAEGAVAGRNQSFQYKYPIRFPAPGVPGQPW